MLQGNKVLLRAFRRSDLELLCQYNNDIEVELAGGGDVPMPQPLERLLAEFDADSAKGRKRSLRRASHSCTYRFSSPRASGSASRTAFFHSVPPVSRSSPRAFSAMARRTATSGWASQARAFAW